MSDFQNYKLEIDTKKAESVIFANEKMADGFKKRVFDIVALLLIVALFLVENGELIIKKQSILTFVGNILVMFMLTLLFDNNYRIKGKLHGMSTEKYVRASKNLKELSENLSDQNINELSYNLTKFLDNQFVQEQKQVLYAVGISFEDYEKSYKKMTKGEVSKILNKTQSRGVQKAKDIKKQNITVDVLLSEFSFSNGLIIHKSQKRLDLEHNLKSVIIYLLTALLFGYFAIGLIENFSILNLGWFLIKCSFLFFRGIKSYFESFIEISTIAVERMESKSLIVKRILNFKN